MSLFTVEKCRICGKLYRIYGAEVRNDPTVCLECEEESGETQKNYIKRKEIWES